MPLFFRKRKPSEEARKRLEYQMCLVRESGFPLSPVSTSALMEWGSTLPPNMPHARFFPSASLTPRGDL